MEIWHCLQARKQSRANGPFKIKITLMTVCKGFHPNWSRLFRDIFTSSQIQSYSDNSFCQLLKAYSECLSIDHSLSTKYIHSTVPLFVDRLMSKEWSIETGPSTHWSPVSPSTNQKWLNLSARRALVRMSAPMYKSWTTWQIWKSRITWYCMSISLVCWWYSGFEKTLIAFWLST